MEIPKFAKRFFVLHMVEGMTGKNEPPAEKILVKEEAARRMDPTFEGKPVVFRDEHMTDEEYESLVKSTAQGAFSDGIVNKSFFNEADGKHWAEILVWSPAGIAACENKRFAVSNAYTVTNEAGPGSWHDLEYNVEVVDGEYEHLLITDKPRYGESKILTPEEFKAYNEGLKRELAAVTNTSKGVSKMFEFFTRKNAENIDENMDVKLPKTGKIVNLSKIINAWDEKLKNEESGEIFAHPDHKVKLANGEVCNVGELIEKHKALAEENTHLKNLSSEYEKGLKDQEKATNPENASEEVEETEEELEGAETEEEKATKKLKKEAEAANKKTNKSGEISEREREILAVRKRIENLSTAPDRVSTPDGFGMATQPVVASREDALKRGNRLGHNSPTA